MTDKMIAILAGMFARSNMGLGRPDARAISIFKESKYDTDAEDAALQLCQEFIEDEAGEEAISREARYWFEYLKEKGEDEARRIHPDMFAIYDAA